MSGTIKSVSGEPLPGVSVVIAHTTTGARSDQNGAFVIRNVKPGKYLLQISLVGYTTISENVEVAAGEMVKRSFMLKESTQQLGEVSVLGKTETQEIKEQAFTVNAIEAKKFANTNVDLNQVLNRSTGVRIREQGGLGSDFNFSVNGLSGKAIRFFIDGVPLEILGNAMTLNNIPVNIAERIEVYKGVVPVELGSDALGGAVNIITNQKVNRFLDASYSYGSFDTHRTSVSGQVASKKTGLILKMSGFHNYSKNNYLMREIELWDADKFEYVRKEVRRFHDRYQSALVQAEAGVVNKSWADHFFVGASYSTNKKDIQTGASQDVVYGRAFSHGNAMSATLKYSKRDLLVKGLHFNLFSSYTRDSYEVVDTSYVRYTWDGNFVATNIAELTGLARSMNNIERPKLFVRGNLVYEINKVHSLNLNYTLDNTRNRIYDAYSNSDPDNDFLNKSIAGLAYQQSLMDGRWSNSFFAKYYHTGAKIEQDEGYYSGDNEAGNGSTNNLGYGIASRFKITENIGVKASFEKAYRLQSAEELLGDGMNLLANYELRPENSRNINIGAYLNHRFDSKHRIYAESGFFYRDVQDFIYSVILLNNKMQYKNTSAVKVTGVEGEVRYGYGNVLEATVNASYQNAINNTREFEGKTDVTYKNKIPNQPWIFGNADIGVGKNNLLGKGTRLQFNWYTQYVHWFYRTWEALGNPDGKARIPTQLIHNAVLSYSVKDGRFNVSAECRNLTNELAFDNFRLQKPGRAFYIKVRTFLR